MLHVWIFIEYLQLLSFMPITNFSLIPYLYDAFRPSLVSHAIFLDDTPLIDGLDDDYFDIYYRNYWISNGKLYQSFFIILMGLLSIMVAHFIVYVIFSYSYLSKNESLNRWATKTLLQFKFNIYLRFCMLIYFDTTFFSVM